MNWLADIKTVAKRLQDHILVSLISGLIARVGIVRFTTAEKAPGVISN